MPGTFSDGQAQPEEGQASDAADAGAALPRPGYCHAIWAHIQLLPEHDDNGKTALDGTRREYVASYLSPKDYRPVNDAEHHLSKLPWPYMAIAAWPPTCSTNEAGIKWPGDS